MKTVFAATVAVTFLFTNFAAAQPANGGFASPVAASIEEHGSYSSQGHTVAYDIFRPQTKQRGVVVFVHGADGLSVPQWNANYARQARSMAAAGFLVFFPHYFDSTGNHGIASGADEIKNFMPWAQAIGDGMKVAQRLGGRPVGPVGIVGVSLGASLSLYVETQQADAAVCVEFYGALPAWVPTMARRWAPTLILHGTADPIVPVANAYKINNALQKLNVPHAMKIYPGQGHGFNGPDETDAFARANRYLAANLAPHAAPAPGSTGPVARPIRHRANPLQRTPG